MLLELIKNKNVAVVGPSSFLNNKNMGELIDSYDIVIKINKFQNLSSKDYGKKTDILFYNFYEDIPDKSIQNCNSKLIIGGHSFENYKDNIKYFQESKEIYNIPHILFPKEKLSLDSKNIIKNGIHKSTGFWVIFLLFNNIDIMKQLNIFGIDFNFNNYNYGYSEKYFSYIYNVIKTTFNHHHHNFNKELYLFKDFFQKYKENKKIIIYDKEFLEFLHNDLRKLSFPKNVMYFITNKIC